MIYFVTEANFPLLDAQIEEVYRRRTRSGDGLSGAVLRRVANDVALLEAVRRVQDFSNLKAMWFKRLESDLADLSSAAGSHHTGSALSPINGSQADALVTGAGALKGHTTTVRRATKMKRAGEPRARRGERTMPAKQASVRRAKSSRVRKKSAPERW